MSVMTCDERLRPMKRARGAAGGTKGLYHANVNVLDESALRDAMERPEEYPQLTVRVSGYAVNNAEAHEGAAGGCACANIPRRRIKRQGARRIAHTVKPRR